MLEFTRYSVERRLRGAVVLSALMAGMAAFTAAFFPSVKESAPQLQDYIDSLPPAFREAFGVESFASIQGFLATEFYTFAWLLVLGLYFGYRAGHLIAGDVESERIELWLALPVSRARLLVERYVALVPTMIVVNVLGALAVVGAVAAIGESIGAVELLAVHALSIPYFLTCAGIGLALTVVTDTADRAARGALGIIFGLFLVESLTAASDFDWLGLLSPTHYYDPSAVLVRAQYDLGGAAILLVAAFALVGLSVWLFRRRDLE